MKLILSTVAERSLISQLENTLSLVNVIDELSLSPLGQGEQAQPPTGQVILLPFSIAFVAVWEREVSDTVSIDGKLVVLAPDDTQLAEHKFTVEPSERLRHRMMTTIPLFPFKGAGTYRFMLSWGDVPATEAWKIDVKFQKA